MCTRVTFTIISPPFIERVEATEVTLGILTLVITAVTGFFLNFIHGPYVTHHSRDNRHLELLTFILTEYNKIDTEHHIYHNGPFVF